MARNWKKYYKRRYKKYYKNKYGNNYGSRGYGQMKAAKQQADQASFVMNIPTQISCKCVKGTVGNRQVELGTYPMNIYDLLRKSEFYQSYANMYDEFKVDNIKVKLIPVKYNVTVGDVNNAGYQSFTVYTAWDRTGLNGKQLYLNTASGVYNNQPINPNAPNGAKNYDFIGKPGDYDGIYCLVGSDITTYSSAESRQVSVGQNSSIVRWLKPKTLAEKSQWLSTAQLKAWYNQYSNADAMFRYIPTSDANSYLGEISKLTNLADRSIGAALNRISPAVANNPCFLEEDPSVSFKPTLLVGLYPADPEDTEIPRTVYFNVETEVSCSFRGLRKSKVVNLRDIDEHPIPEIDLEPLEVSQFGNYARPDPDTEGYNPVTVAPAQGAFVQSTFDNEELTETDLENFAIQSSPNDCQIRFINTEIPHQQGDYIPNATLTKYIIGNYLFTENGINMMNYAGEIIDPESPEAWVIPAVIQVNVPPPQMDPNENIINSNGVFNLIDNDSDPEIEIEPSEDDDTPTPTPNIQRGTLIKSNKTVKSFKLAKQGEETRDGEEQDTRVSLGQIRVQVPMPNITQISDYPITQNGTQTVPIPTGSDAVDSISLNVNVSPVPLTAYKLKVVSNSRIYRFYQFTKVTSTNKTFTNNSTTSNKYFIVIIHSSYSKKWRVTRYYMSTNKTVTLTTTPSLDVYYFDIESNNNSSTMKIFCDINGVDFEYINLYTGYTQLYESTTFSISEDSDYFNDDMVSPDFDFDHN